MTIKHVIGDATHPREDVPGMKFITHCCNNVGAWGAGFVLALSRRWGTPELMYRRWAQERPAELREAFGKVQVAPVEKDIIVVNIIGQDGVGRRGEAPPIRYDALEIGLQKVQETMEKYNKPTLHIPRIGCGLAGGEWSKVEELIKKTIKFDTYVYTLPHEAKKYGLKEEDVSP
jgi:O-acetyl-ADP-ribose deacetylase (regulator of RNase III)